MTDISNLIKEFCVFLTFIFIFQISQSKLDSILHNRIYLEHCGLLGPSQSANPAPQDHTSVSAQIIEPEAHGIVFTSADLN